ncbi:MAG: hypothetical protein ACI9IP_003274 [Arcticibacterium sp.]|jgi:hypothetical protein
MPQKNAAKMSKTNSSLLIILSIFSTFHAVAQDVYDQKGENEIHRLFLDDHYLIEAVFLENPAKFISTRGGFYSSTNEGFQVKFEFNSDFEIDGLKMAHYNLDASWEKINSPSLDLEGKWQMGGRINESSISRRDTSNARKKNKVLFKGHFQWIAYHIETMKFSDTGGGQYVIQDGKYT